MKNLKVQTGVTKINEYGYFTNDTTNIYEETPHTKETLAIYNLATDTYVTSHSVELDSIEIKNNAVTAIVYYDMDCETREHQLGKAKQI